VELLRVGDMVTVVELVLGGRPIPTGARVSPEAVRAVGDWAAAGPREAAVGARGE
jgi:uncharacterized protein (DUF433 family)